MQYRQDTLFEMQVISIHRDVSIVILDPGCSVICFRHFHFSYFCQRDTVIMRYKNIPGHDTLKQKLIRSIQHGRLGHAQLLSGAEGSAALPLALATAQYIMCQDPQENDSCGACPSCQKHENLIHPDMHYVFPVIPVKSNKENLSNNFLPQWREAILNNPFLTLERWYDMMGVQNQQGNIYTSESDEIVRKFSLKSFESDYTILVMWHPGKMIPDAANKLLKLIEEPPDNTFFFLVSSDPDKILPTIVSRCQQFNVPAISDQELTDYLSSGYNLSAEQGQSVARMFEGNIGLATEYSLNADTGNVHFEDFVQWMRITYKLNIPGLTDWIDRFAGSGREHQKSFFSYTLHMLRENFMLHNTTGQVHLSDEERKFSDNFSTFIHEGNIGLLYQCINEAYDYIEDNANPRILMMDTSFKIHHLINR